MSKAQKWAIQEIEGGNIDVQTAMRADEDDWLDITETYGSEADAMTRAQEELDSEIGDDWDQYGCGESIVWGIGTDGLTYGIWGDRVWRLVGGAQ